MLPPASDNYLLSAPSPLSPPAPRSVSPPPQEDLSSPKVTTAPPPQADYFGQWPLIPLGPPQAPYCVKPAPQAPPPPIIPPPQAPPSVHPPTQMNLPVRYRLDMWKWVWTGQDIKVVEIVDIRDVCPCLLRGHHCMLPHRCPYPMREVCPIYRKVKLQTRE